MRLFLLIYCLSMLSAGFAQDFELGLPEGHKESIQSASFSPGDKYAITTGGDKTIKMWQVQNGRLLRSFSYSSDEPVFHPSGKLMLLFSADSTWMLDVVTGKILYKKAGRINGMFTPDGKKILDFSWQKGLSIYDLTLKLTDTLFSEKSFWLKKISRDGKLLYNTFLDHTETLVISELANFKMVKKLAGHTASIEVVDESDDLSLIATAAKDNSIRIWKSATGQCTRIIKEKTEIKSIQFHPNSQFLLVTLKDSLVKLYDAYTGRLIKKINTDNTYQEPASFSTDGKYLLTYGDSIRVWSTKNFKPIYLFGSTETVSFSGDSKLLITYKSGNEYASIRSIEDGRVIHFLKNKMNIVKLSFYGSSNKSIISSCDDNGELRLWEPATGRLLNKLSGHKAFARLQEFSPDGTYILTSCQDNTMGIWNAASSRLLHLLYDTAHYTDIPNTLWQNGFSPDGKLVFVQSHNQHRKNKLDVFETISGKCLYTLDTETDFKNGFSIQYQFNPAGNHFVTSWTDDTIRTFESYTGKLLAKYPVPDKASNHATYSADGKYLLISADSSAFMMDITTGKFIKNIHGKSNHFGSAAFSDNGKYMLLRSRDTLYIHDAISWKHLITLFETGDEAVQWSPDDKYVATINEDDIIKVWEFKSGNLLFTFKHPRRNNPSAIPFEFSPNSQYLIANFYSGSWVWNLQTGKKEAEAYSIDKDYIIMLPSGYYQCTPGAAKKLYYVKEDQTIGIGQLDIRFNRPDFVIKSFNKITGNTDTTLSAAFYKAWQKRMGKLGIKTLTIAKSKNVPEADFINRGSFESESMNREVQLHIKASDSTVNLVKLNLWLNETPLLGAEGLNLQKRNAKYFDTTLTVTLSQGKNNIETSVMNINGTESYRKPLQLNYVPAVMKKSTLHYIGIGINNYTDTSMNLHYAVKDVTDLANEFKERNPGAEIITLTNEAATRKNILALKSKLLQTSIEDKVVISFSGHGLLDDNLNFYCSTYDINFKKPSVNGLLYNELLSLLENIPARRKLLLIDACNSGEIDKEEEKQENIAKKNFPKANPLHATTATNTEGKLLSFGKAKGNILLGKKSVGLQNSFEMMKEMFADFSLSNGIVVISAAGGREYAYEGKQYDNGVFTYSIKKGLLQAEADRNGDFNVSVSELKDYVSQQVELLTEGKQKPTSRSQTLSYDWLLLEDNSGLKSSPLAQKYLDKATIANSASDYLLSIQYLLQAKTILKEENNYFNNDYTRLCRNLAINYGNLGDTINNIKWYEEEIAIRKKISRNTRDCANAMASLAILYKHTGNAQAAEPLYMQVAEIEKEVSGARSNEYAYSLNQLGIFYDERDEYEKAKVAYQASVDILQKTNQFNRTVNWKDQYHTYILIIKNLAWLYRKNKDYDLAAPLYQVILNETGFADGKESEAYALALNQQAINKEHTAKKDNVDALYIAALHIYEQLKNTNNADYIAITGNLSYYYRKNGLLNEALVYAKKSADQSLTFYGKDHEELASAINKLAIVYQRMKKYKYAQDYYRLAMTVYAKAKGENDPETITVKKNLERLYAEMEKNK